MYRLYLDGELWQELDTPWPLIPQLFDFVHDHLSIFATRDEAIIAVNNFAKSLGLELTITKE